MRWLAAGAVIATTALPPVAFAQDAGADKAGGLAAEPNKGRGDELNDRHKLPVERGLAWLAAKQAQDGGFAGHGYSNHAGITALAGIAFMQAGNLPGRGKYGKEVQQCLDFVLNSCTESGLIASDMTQGPMYGHGFATLFLAEVYGMTGDESVKEKLQRPSS